MIKDVKPFLHNFEGDVINTTIQKMGRGPIMPSENVLDVLAGQKISLAAIGATETMRIAADAGRFDLMSLVTDILHELRHPEQYGVPMDEKGKVLVKSSTGALSQQTDSISYPFVKQETQQPSNPMNLTQHFEGNAGNKAA